jgi:hypothetical protein
VVCVDIVQSSVNTSMRKVLCKCEKSMRGFWCGFMCGLECDYEGEQWVALVVDAERHTPSFHVGACLRHQPHPEDAIHLTNSVLPESIAVCTVESKFCKHAREGRSRVGVSAWVGGVGGLPTRAL